MQTENLTQPSHSTRYRVFFTCVVAALMMLLVGCSSANEAPPPVYSPEQINLIQEYTSDLKDLRARIDELPGLIEDEDWSDVKNLIHGPLGELRFKMLNIARNLSPNLESRARDISKDVFNNLVEIDASAQVQSSAKSFEGYNKLVKNYEKFLDIIPSEATAS